jgi:hypothetical protein
MSNGFSSAASRFAEGISTWTMDAEVVWWCKEREVDEHKIGRVCERR